LLEYFKVLLRASKVSAIQGLGLREFQSKVQGGLQVSSSFNSDMNELISWVIASCPLGHAAESFKTIQNPLPALANLLQGSICAKDHITSRPLESSRQNKRKHGSSQLPASWLSGMVCVFWAASFPLAKPLAKSIAL